MIAKSFLGTATAALALVLGLGQAEPINRLRGRADLEDFIAAQSDISIAGVLANIGADGSKAPGVPPGVVVASPSRSDPDYWYTWTRDAALTYKALVERFIAGDSSLQRKIDEYVSAQAQLQQLDNPSGAARGAGLGEPKFLVDLTQFTGSWGRPQRDGPPLRATALILYANWLIQNGQRDKAAQQVWPVISLDLAYTVRFWNSTGYDLWEEVNGSSFFTIAASHRALVEGAALAAELGQTCDGCASNAPRVLCFAQSFWVGSYIDSNINVNDGRTGLDANSLLSSLHTFDPEANCTDATFQPCSARALSNHKAVVDSFRAEYAINRGIPQGRAPAIGRYNEDVYYNGNPWYLTTLAAAEQLYSAVYQWDRIGSITVNQLSLPFFRDLVPSVSTGTYASGSSTYNSLVNAVRTYADDFIAKVQQYTPSNGALAEQYDRNTGAPLSARDLTWSYAAFLTAIERRNGTVPPTWGEGSANTVPSVCTGTPSCNSRITFNVRVTTVPGEDIYVVGGLTQLGNWSPSNGVALSASRYTANDPLWYVEVNIPAETAFEYKYIKVRGNTVSWESDPNRRYTTSQGCSSSGTVNDVWR
ncbi:putative glucoamylase GMY2 [Stachybotrys elegans]|uniref:Glucoamylase n=1 Tax=Stachybotrys elegans TaxID=80388 RepID=A0A8K0T0N9_9HYPO|nr:putative glucoamylase GMY2 [Stachybotrys elegans]